jgi:hypothetical protein
VGGHYSIDVGAFIETHLINVNGDMSVFRLKLLSTGGGIAAMTGVEEVGHGCAFFRTLSIVSVRGRTYRKGPGERATATPPNPDSSR